MKFTIFKHKAVKTLPTPAAEPELKSILLLPDTLRDFDPCLHITFGELPETGRAKFHRTVPFTYTILNKELIKGIKKPLFDLSEFKEFKPVKNFYPILII